LPGYALNPSDAVIGVFRDIQIAGGIQNNIIRQVQFCCCSRSTVSAGARRSVAGNGRDDSIDTYLADAMILRI
jgi:hypothetical protein